MPRAAGILLHPTSLPGRFGVGDLGPGALTFFEWLASAGQTLWQVMPLGPTGYHDSPYGGLSAFAGNPLLISPERLVEEGLLAPSALEDAPDFPAGRVDFARVLPFREELLRASWEQFQAHAPASIRSDLEAFLAAPDQAYWLADWTLFSSLKERHDGADWTAWPSELRRREPAALSAARAELARGIRFHEYLQFLFFRHWDRVRADAHRLGLRVIGDVPIYVSGGSADVWAHPRLFTIDADGRPETVAGVPPDYFSDTGQLWGNPLFRWDVLEREGFAWWVERIRMNLRLADTVRIDHFRGLAAYWEVPATDETALNGRWVKGPGRRLVDVLRRELGSLDLVAEDLGHITVDVKELLDSLGLPGMKVLQFAFAETNSEHLPHWFTRNTVVYTGTHDNDTARGWFASACEEERGRALDTLGTDGREIEWDLIRAAYTSVADRAIVPLQDVLGLESEARMNLPGKAHGNWAWRARAEQLTPGRAARLKRLVELTGRASLPSARPV